MPMLHASIRDMMSISGNSLFKKHLSTCQRSFSVTIVWRHWCNQLKRLPYRSVRLCHYSTSGGQVIKSIRHLFSRRGFFSAWQKTWRWQPSSSNPSSRSRDRKCKCHMCMTHPRTKSHLLQVWNIFACSHLLYVSLRAHSCGVEDAIVTIVMPLLAIILRSIVLNDESMLSPFYLNWKSFVFSYYNNIKNVYGRILLILTTHTIQSLNCGLLLSHCRLYDVFAHTPWVKRSTNLKAFYIPALVIRIWVILTYWLGLGLWLSAQ